MKHNESFRSLFNRRRLWQCAAASAICIVPVLAPLANAQSTFGSVLGSVTDASNLPVARASVKLVNTDENTSRDTQTDNAGNYEFLNVKPGQYTVAVDREGFAKFVSKDLTLVARQNLRLDPVLDVGALTQTVEVQASAGVITTETQTVSATFNEQKLQN